MASLRERNGSLRFIFRFHGRSHFVTLGKAARPEADAKAARVEHLFLRLQQRLIELPPGVGIAEFLQHDGKPSGAPQNAPAGSRALTLADFRDRDLATHRNSLEERTVEGIGLHFKRLVAVLGERYPIRDLKLSDLQGYVPPGTADPAAEGGP